MIIENGSDGACYRAKVTSNSELVTRARTNSVNHFVNEHDEEAYTYYAEVTPTAADDVFSYIKNTSDKDMVINWYRVWSGTTAEAIDIYFNPTGTPGGTTTVTPSNMNVGSLKQAAGEFYSGNDITGLTLGTKVDRIRLAGNGEDVVDGYPGDIIVPKSSSVALTALTGAIAIEVTISFYYELG